MNRVLTLSIAVVMTLVVPGPAFATHDAGAASSAEQAVRDTPRLLVLEIYERRTRG